MPAGANTDFFSIFFSLSPPDVVAANDVNVSMPTGPLDPLRALPGPAQSVRDQGECVWLAAARNSQVISATPLHTKPPERHRPGLGVSAVLYTPFRPSPAHWGDMVQGSTASTLVPA